MSIWNHWAHRIAQAAEALGGAVYAPVGLVADLATAPWNNDQSYNGMINTLASRTAARAQQAFAPIDFLAGPVDEQIGHGIVGALNWSDRHIYNPGVRHPLATLALAGAMSHQGGRQDPLDTGIFKNWGAAWQQSRHMTVGQAMSINWGAQSPAFAAPVLSPTGAPITDVNAALTKVDWTKGQARIESGVGDILTRWYADPTVLGGKAAGLARLKLLTKPVTAATNVDQVVESGRVNRFVNELHKRPTPDARMDWLMRNPTIRSADDGPAIAELLARTDNAEDARAVLKSALNSDPDAVARLASQRTDLQTAIMNIRNDRISPLEKAVARETKTKNWFTAQNAQQLDLWRAETARLSDQIDATDLAARAEGTLNQVPRAPLINQVADKVSWNTYQPSRYNLPMRVVRSAGSMRSGVIDINRNDSIVQLQRMLDRVGHGVGKGAGLDDASKGELLRRYASATTEGEKAAAILSAEARAMNHVADQLGLSRSAAQAALKDGWQRRDELRGVVRERAYSGAKDATGNYVDYMDVDGVLTRLPLDVTQLAHEVPMMDVDAVGRIMGRYRDTINNNEAGFGDMLRKLRSSEPVEFTAGHIEEAASAITRLWKPAQLLRLGWPMRVIGDEQLRIMATLGAISHLPMVAGSVRSARLGVSRDLSRSLGSFRTGRLAAIDKRLADISGDTALDVERAKLLDERGNLVKIMDQAPKPAPEFGLGEVQVGPYTVEDAFGSSMEAPNVYKSLASSRPAYARLAEDSGRMLDHLRAQAGPTRVLTPSDGDAYQLAWSRAVNDQIGHSPLAQRILRGQSDDDIARWLTKDPDGVAYAKRIGPRGGDVHRWIGELRTHIDHYLPTDELKALALTRRARFTDLAKTITDPSLRPEVHGESLELSLGTSKISKTWQTFVDRSYAALGSAPTDVLSRHPFFVNIYRQRLGHLVDRYDPAASGELTGATLTKLSARAREHALRQVRHTLYELSEESNLAHTLRFVMPFYAAWQEALTRWLGLGVADPSRLARGALMWNSPEDAGITQSTPQGDVVIVPMPKWARDHIPGAKDAGSMAFSKKQANILLSGDPWFLPGVGPLVAVPVASLVRSKPDIEESMRYILPYGAGTSWKDMILPAAGRRALVAAEGEDNRQFVNTFNRISIDLETDRRLGKNTMTDDELFAEARRRSQAFWRLRTVANMTLPVSPAFRSPYQFYWDKARAYRTKYANDKKESWEEHFLQDFGPDYFAFTASLSKSTNSVAPTVNGYRASKKFDDLLASLPANSTWGSLVVGDEDAGTFSGAVYAYQFNHGVGPGDLEHQRVVRSPRETVSDIDRREGWIYFRKISTAINAALIDRGINPGPGALNRKSAQDLSMIKRAMVDRLAQLHPDWYSDYRAYDPGKAGDLVRWLGDHAADPRFQDRPGWASLRRYLDGRKLISQALEARAEAGGSRNLQANVNSDINAVWDAYVGNLVERDTNFEDTYNRWLTSDTMEQGGSR